MSYTKKKNFWGSTIYSDESGNELGHEETSIFTGKRGVYNDGHKVADIERDYNENDNLVFRSGSLFGRNKVVRPKNANTDLDFDDDGEFLYGDEG